MFGPFARRCANSATLMSWASVSTRALTFVLVLPLLLVRLTAAEVAVWYLLSSVISLQMLADMGFAPTFARVLAFASAGRRDLRNLGTPVANTGGPDWEMVGRIYRTMGIVYRRLTGISMLIIAVVGTAALDRPLAALDEPARGWTAWCVVLAASAITMQGNRFGAFLQGMNRIALYRRWEAIIALASIVSSAVVLLSGGRLLALVIASQGWAVCKVWVDRRLCRLVEGGSARETPSRGIDREVLDAVWPSAWRSGLGVLMTRGTTHASGLILAQVATAPVTAGYLLALRLVSTVADLSQAPFYSKLPLLAQLRSEGRVVDQISVAQLGMRRAYWTYVAGFIGLGVVVPTALHLIPSTVPWVSPQLWVLLGLAFLVERYGAMHIQLYSTTNHIVWHIANGVTGVLYIGLALLLLPHLGVYAFPTAMLAAFAGFYAWYSAGHVYRAFHIRAVPFERHALLVPLGIALLYAGFALLS